jgi:hypothetical protein
LTVTEIGASHVGHDASTTVIVALPTPIARISARGDGGGHGGGSVENTGSGEGLAGSIVTTPVLLDENVTVSFAGGVLPGAGEFAQ